MSEEEVRDVSLYEFWWKYNVIKSRVKKCSRPVCLMVTPCFSAGCANAEHPSHESYARAMVVAHWRHMSSSRRHAMIRDEQDTKQLLQFVLVVQNLCNRLPVLWLPAMTVSLGCEICTGSSRGYGIGAVVTRVGHLL